MKTIFPIIVIYLSGLAAIHCRAQTIPYNRLTNWANAGLADTVPDFSNKVNIMNYGAYANGMIPDDTALARAIAALNNQPGTVIIPAGTYLFRQPVNLERDSIVIRGEGSATRLLFNLSWPLNNMFNIRGTIEPDTLKVQHSITKNDRSIVLSSVTGLHDGDYLYLFCNDSDLVTSPWAYTTSGQILRIEKINGDTVYVETPPRRSYKISSGIYILKMKPVRHVGLECMYIERTDSTNARTNNIDLFAAADCWISGIESNMTNYSHVAINYSTHVLVRGCYFHHAHSYGDKSEAYGANLEFTSGDCLVENNIFEHLRHSMVVQAGANGNVISYNYSLDPYWTQPPSPADAAGDIVCHGDYPYLNLFEGNVAQNIIVDDSHGINGPFNTFFRNKAELYGISTLPGAADSTNYTGNEVTGTTGNYSLSGKGYFEYGNNLNGTIMPVGTSALPELSLYMSGPPGYWEGNISYPGIGTPYAYNKGNNPAYRRYTSQSRTDCTRNPHYITVQQPLQADDEIAAYPNPFKDVIILRSATGKRSCFYQLYSMTGMCVLAGDAPGDQTIINTASLPEGIYLLIIRDQKGIIISKRNMIKTGR
ncbi:MAG: T9SS type A sorting domain-containing protein [Chitinophagales bacterium]|nr:T9SS type A sorting domain-containing protein [Chitinophagales bacterium]